ncbi:MAG: pseudouridine synthase [Myxococcota bacterium]|nr:pseudouridine synthase [Myxococcota bacterium]
MDFPPQLLTLSLDGRVERSLAHELGLSRRVAVLWLKEGRVRVDGRRISKGDRLPMQTEVSLSLQGKIGIWVRADKQPLPLLAKGADWLALDKPAGMPSHVSLPFEEGCAINHFAAHRSEVTTCGEDPLQGGLVHRLDNEASGLLLAASSAAAWRRLREQFSSASVRRVYRARTRPVDGIMPKGRGEIRQPLSSAGAKVRADENGRATHTLWRALDDNGLLEIELRSGHRHQIRVHLAGLGWPIIGDALYGGVVHPRLLLHCQKLSWEAQVLTAAPSGLLA